MSMGITGLLTFLEKSSRRANVKEFSGETVAIDAYCWLHKGASSCADKLIMNEPTVLYVNYCMKFINMLLSNNIKPILVFDGRYLPAKAEIEEKRRISRSINRKKGAELLQAGHIDQGRSFLRRSVDITHAMALNLIKQCRERNIDCIVAPYEADAQLAYLNITNIAQLVITEDSDLLLFGCSKVLFKMDINGNGILIEKDKLHISMGVRHDSFSMDKFRYMCILSGCDYLPSLRGIGLSKARKFINRTSEQNMYEALLKLPVNLQMWTLAVTDKYRTAFVEADRTFRYQLVYDPIQRKQVPLNETGNGDDYIGEKLAEDMAFQLAIGNLDPMTMEKLDDYNPDKHRVYLNNNNKNLVQSHSSIWSNNFTPRVVKRSSGTSFPVHSSTKSLSIIASVSMPVKRPVESECAPDQVTGEFLNNLYGMDKGNDGETSKTVTEKKVFPAATTPGRSPVLFRRKNPFALQSPISNSSKKQCLMDTDRFGKTIDSKNLLRSRYFEQVEDFSDKIPNKNSVLDIIDKEANCSNMLKTDESQGETGNNVENYSYDCILTRKLNSEFENSSADFQFFSQSGRSNSVETAENDETPKENSYSLLDSKISENEHLENIIEVPSAAKCTKKKFVLSPVNDSACVKRNFYSLCKTEDAERAHASPYFQKMDSSNNSVRVLEFDSIAQSDRKPLIRSTKKIPQKNGLSKCNQRKQQSLLTRFGFQPKSKVQSTMT